MRGLRHAPSRPRAVPADHGPGDAVPERGDLGQPRRARLRRRTRRRSVHLAGYPEVDEARIATACSRPMADVRAVCELGHRARAEAKLRVRQPLASAVVSCATPARLQALEALQRRDRERAQRQGGRPRRRPRRASSSSRSCPTSARSARGWAPKVQEVRGALAAGDYQPDDDGVVQSPASVLAVGDYELRRTRARASRRRPTARWSSRSTPA